MLMIRLARRGKKNSPFYRVIVSEKGRDMFGDALEIVGHYNSVSPNKDASFNKERILYWISKGAHASPTVYNLLVSNNIVVGTKVVKKRIQPKKEANVSAAATAAQPSAVVSAIPEQPSEQA